jgi:hypothetical protein
VFNYALVDGDGDVSPATLTISLTGSDDVPTANTPPVVLLDDDALANGNAGGVGDDIDEANTSGTLTGSGGDGDLDFFFSGTQTGVPAGFTTNLVNAGTLQILQGGTVVLTVTLNNESGAYTVTQNAAIDHSAGANENNVPDINISFFAVDADGSPSAPKNLTINVDDDTPVISISAVTQAVVTVDESGPAAAATLSTGTVIKGDDPHVTGSGAIGKASSGTAVVNAAVLFGADGSGGAPTYALVLGSQDTPLTLTDGSTITLQQVAGGNVIGVVDNGPFAGQAAFAISINPATGVVTVEQYLSLDHPDVTDPNDPLGLGANTLGVTVTAIDGDGDTVTSPAANISGQITFLDDGPVIAAVSGATIVNSGTVSGTGTFAFTTGADGPLPIDDAIKSVTFNGTINNVAVTNPTITAVSETATTALFNISFTYSTGPGTTTTATGTLTFDKAGGTYTVDLAQPIAGFTISSTSQGSAFVGYEAGTTNTDNSQPQVSVTTIRAESAEGAGDGLFVQFTGAAEPGSGTGTNNLTTKGDANTGAFANGDLFTQASAFVSTSNDANGVAGDTIQGGEVLDFNLYSSNPKGVLNMEPTATATDLFFKLDGIGAQEDFIVILKLYDAATDTYTTRAVMVQNSDIFKGPGTGPGTYSGVKLDQNDGLVIIESNDYNLPGDDDTPPESYVIVGAQIVGSDEGITGTAINLNGAIGVTGDSAATATTFDTQAFSTDVNDGPFKISDIGFVTPSTTAQQAVLNFNATIQDGDGDTASAPFTVTVGTAPVATLAATSSISAAETQDDSATLLAVSDQSGGKKLAEPANSNTAIIGAVAAVGLAATPVAANDTVSLESNGQAAVEVAAEQVAIEASEQSGSPSGVQGFAGETREALDTDSEVATTAARDSGSEQARLTSEAAQAPEPDALPQGTEAPASAPAQSSFTSAGVAMPSAEMLEAAANENAAAQGEGRGQGTHELGRVLADALAGGRDGPNLDAVINALARHGQGGDQGVDDALASQAAAAVPGWNMGGGAHFQTAHSAFTVEAMMLHHDAVQPAA